MAAIDTYLQQILDAVYGEEVRGAIHDAIQQVYDDGRSGVPTSRKINGHDLTTDVTLTASDVWAVPTSRTVNGKALSSDISLSASDVSALSNDRTITINGVSKNLSSNPSFTVEAEAGVPATRTINGHALSDDVTLTASDVGAVPTTRTVNSKALSSNISLSASDVGAVPTTRKITINGTAKTLDQDVSFTVEGGGGTGSVTSVRVQATSPVVSSVSTAQTASLDTTISLANNYGDTKNPYASKTANYVLASPNGSAGAPSFRALVAADIPSLSASKITSGTMTGPITQTGSTFSAATFNVKHTNIDLKSTTNGVSEIQYPGFTILDKNNLTVARFESIVNPNGQTGFHIYADQYNTDGSFKKRAGIGVSITKQGFPNWTIEASGNTFWKSIAPGYSTSQGLTWQDAYLNARNSIKVVFKITYSNNVHVLVIDIPKMTITSNGQFFFSSSCVHDGKQLFAQGMYTPNSAEWENVFLGSDVQTYDSKEYYYI